MYQHRHETTVEVGAPAAAVFDYADDPVHLSSHMSGKNSWMMGGGAMKLETDAAGGRRLGSILRLSGRAFGMALELEEAVTERMPPYHKAWETRGEPKLLVIGPYRMGFDIEGFGHYSRLRVFIDYDMPSSGAARVAGRLFGKAYARWCTRRMARDTAQHFRVAHARRPT